MLCSIKNLKIKRVKHFNCRGLEAGFIFAKNKKEYSELPHLQWSRWSGEINSFKLRQNPFRSLSTFKSQTSNLLCDLFWASFIFPTKSIDMIYYETNNGVCLPRIHMMTKQVRILSIEYEYRLEMKWYFYIWMLFMDTVFQLIIESNKRKKEIDRQIDK